MMTILLVVFAAGLVWFGVRFWKSMSIAMTPSAEEDSAPHSDVRQQLKEQLEQQSSFDANDSTGEKP